MTRARARPFALGALALGALTLAMTVQHVRHGGFYFDDWGALAAVRFPAHAGQGALDALWPWYGQRPGQVAWYALLESTLGYRPQAQAALAAVLAGVEAMLLLALLRRLGLTAPHALLVSALVLVFPFSDSAWLWPVMSLATLTICLAGAGLALALRALEARGRRALALHAGSLALYAVGILSYEVFAVAGSLAGLLYVRQAGWRRARLRWALDLVAILGTLAIVKRALPVDVATPSRAQSPAGAIHHAGAIATAGARLIGAAALPIGGPSAPIALVALAAVHALVAAARRRLSPGDPAHGELRRWQLLAGAGLLLAAAAWAAYAPAPDHYTPWATGTVNRINVLAAVGVVLLVYATLAAAATLAGRLAAARLGVAAPTVALAVTAAGAGALGGAYLLRTAQDARVWDRAAAEQRGLLASVHSVLPRLPAGATVYAFDHPATVGPVPVLGTAQDLTAALRLSYGSGRLWGAPVDPTALQCGPGGVSATVAGGNLPAVAPYGRAYLIDVDARRAAPLSSRARCDRLARDGPLAVRPPA